MSSQGLAVTINGHLTTFSMKEDSIRVKSPNQDIEIELDMLMTSSEREEILSALASGYFISQRSLMKMLKREDDHVSEFFTSESYDFMQYLNGVGLPAPISAQTAFLTDNSGKVTLKERVEFFENFRSSLHSLKQVQKGLLSGLTTLIPYYMISQLYGSQLASRASKRVYDDPERLFELARGILKYRGGVINNDLTDMQFNVLIDMATEGFPPSNSAWGPKLSKYLVELVLSDFNWALAEKHSLESKVTPAKAKLAAFVKLTVLGSNFSGANNSIANVSSILSAKFSDQALAGAFEVLELNELQLKPANAEHFIAFVTIADYITSGGGVDDSIDWMIAMEPAIEVDKLKENVYIASQDGS